jgi:hypothetical protein
MTFRVLNERANFVDPSEGTRYTIHYDLPPHWRQRQAFMRWFVEISPLGKSEAEPERQCVEASQWQEAIKGVRRAAGLDDALRNFSIEVLDEGVRAVDPMSRLRYVIRKAPGDAPLTGQQAQAQPAPAAPAPSVPAPPKSPSVPPPATKKAKAQTMVYGSPGAAEFNQAVQQAQAQFAPAPSAPPPAPSAPPPAPSAPAPSAPAPSAPAPSAPAPSAPAPSAPAPSAPAPSAPAPVSPAYTRAVFPPKSQPESRPRPVYSAPQPAPVAASPAPAPVPASTAPAASTEPYNVLAKREEEPSKASPLSYREYAYAIAEDSTEDDAEKFIVARFKEIRDAMSSTQSAKLVNLAVFDHQFKGKPKRPPLVTLVWKDWKGDPEVRFTSRPGVSIPPPSLGKIVPASVPPAKISQPPAEGAKPGVMPTPPSTPVAIRHNRGNLGPPQPTMRSAESSIDPSSLGAKVQVSTEPAPQPAPVAPQPAPVAPQPAPVAPQPAPVAPQPAPVAPQPAPVAPQPAPVAPQPAPVAPQPAPVAPQPAPVAPQPAPVAPQPAKKPAPPKPPTGDEIIADIFESMHDLHFLRDAYEGADFVIALALDKMRCKLGIAQLYDINRREFVVAHAVGPGSQKALGNRTTEHDPMLIEIMNRRTPFVVEARTDHRILEGRWTNLGGEPQTILACSVAQGGRFLGILELAHVKGEGEFRKADIDGMAYIAQSFAEFVAKTGLLFGSEKDLIRG